MIDSFTRAWGRDDIPDLSLADKIRLAALGKGRLRKRVLETMRRLEKCSRRLGALLSRFESMEMNVKARMKEAYLNGNEVLAKALANEAANIEQAVENISLLKILFEQMVMRFNIILTVGDVTSQLGPLRKLLRVAAPMVARVMPKLTDELVNVKETLEMLAEETDMSAHQAVPVQLTSRRAADIYEALSLTVEQDEALGLPEASGRRVRGRGKVGGGL